jgi:hypothetical protein
MLKLVLAVAFVSSLQKLSRGELQAPGVEYLKYEQPTNLTGSIYPKGSDGQQPLFRFKRVASHSGSALNVVREFTYPDGKLAARERVVYEGDSLVEYELDELQIEAKGSAKIHFTEGNPAKKRIEFEYTTGEGAARRFKPHSEPLQEDTLIADMIGPFLAAHWDVLQRGQKVKCRYIAVARKETVGFTFVRESESSWHGKEVMIVKMEPTSLIISALVGPLFFTIEKASPHRVLQYIGRTTPKIEVRGSWKDLDGVTVFDWP